MKMQLEAYPGNEQRLGYSSTGMSTSTVPAMVCRCRCIGLGMDLIKATAFSAFAR